MTTITDARGVQIKVKEDGFLAEPVPVSVELSELLNCDLEQFLDLISERAGFPLMMQQEYTIDFANSEGLTLVFMLNGDVSEELDFNA